MVAAGVRDTSLVRISSIAVAVNTAPHLEHRASSRSDTSTVSPHRSQIKFLDKVLCTCGAAVAARLPVFYGGPLVPVWCVFPDGTSVIVLAHTHATFRGAERRIDWTVSPRRILLISRAYLSRSCAVSLERRVAQNLAQNSPPCPRFATQTTKWQT